MTTEQPTRTPGIRGEERLALVEDLALGEKTHAELAVVWGRTTQTIHQFSARNAAEIASRRRVLQGELATATDHLWVADKTTRIAFLQKLIEDLDIHLSNDDLDPRLRNRLTREVASLLRNVADEKGELRSKVDVTSMPLTDFDVIALDESGNWHGVADH